MDLTVSLAFAKQDNSSCYAGGIAAAAHGHSSLQRLTVDLTVAENSVYMSVSGLVGGGSGMTLTGCAATVTENLTAGQYGMSGGLVGQGSGITLTGCTAEVGGSLTVTGL